MSRIYSIAPTAKPRMSRADAWKQRPCVLRYRAFCDEARLRMGPLDMEGARVVFFMPMPKSWSKKKRAEMKGQPHRQAPDLSNLIKALEDALYVGKNCKAKGVRPEFQRDDSTIGGYASLRKVWDERAAILIETRKPKQVVDLFPEGTRSPTPFDGLAA